MRRHAGIWPVFVLAVTWPCVVLGQGLVTPSAENTLTVAVEGSAEAAADWAEVSLAVEAQGATAQEAMLSSHEACEGATAELVKEGLDAQAIRRTPPRFTGGGLAAMVGPPGDDQQAQFSVSRTIIVRLGKPNLETLYGEVCRIIDAGVTGGATGIGTPTSMSEMWSSGGLVTLGVDDTKALRAQAVANGLAEAKELAEIVAAQAGKKLGPIVGLNALGSGWEGVMAMMTKQPESQQAGRAVRRLSLNVTFQLQ